MNVSRAAFLKVCGAALVGASLPSWTASRSRIESVDLNDNDNDNDTDNANGADAGPESEAARYRAHVGSVFTIEGASRQVRLTSVEETAAHARIEQFSLNFRALAGAPIPHGTYWLRHRALGRIEMYITPVGAPAGSPVYQACFSRIIHAMDHSCPTTL